MPIITKISTQKRKGRYNIFIDNEYAFSVSERTLAEKRLLKGTELSLEDIEKIKKAEADSHALQLAMSYLSYQPRSVYEVLTYLNKQGISPEASQSAIENLIGLNYLDDNNFANPARIMINTVLEVNQLISSLCAQEEKLQEEYGQHHKFCIILDSLGNIASNKEIEDGAEGRNSADMSKAKHIRSLFRCITVPLSRLQWPLIVVNQIYASLSMYSPGNTQSGGLGIAFNSSVTTLGSCLVSPTITTFLAQDNANAPVAMSTCDASSMIR